MSNSSVACVHGMPENECLLCSSEVEAFEIFEASMTRPEVAMPEEIEDEFSRGFAGIATYLIKAEKRAERKLKRKLAKRITEEGK